MGTRVRHTVELPLLAHDYWEIRNLEAFLKIENALLNSEWSGSYVLSALGLTEHPPCLWPLQGYSRADT